MENNLSGDFYGLYIYISRAARSSRYIARVYATISCVYFDCAPGERRRQAPPEERIVSGFLSSLRYALFSLNELIVEQPLSQYLEIMLRLNNVNLRMTEKEQIFRINIIPFSFVSIFTE